MKLGVFEPFEPFLFVVQLFIEFTTRRPASTDIFFVQLLSFWSTFGSS